MRNIFFALIFIGFSITIVLALASSNLWKNIQKSSVVTSGRYLGDDPVPDPGGKWFALHYSKSGWQLSSAKVIKVIIGKYTDLPEYDIKSSVKNTEILLRDMGLKPGKINIIGGSILGSKYITCIRTPSCVEKYTYKSMNYELITKAIKKDKNRHGEIKVQLTLVQYGKQKKKQILIDEYTNYIIDLNWHLKLAGDLDHDGKIDLIIQTIEGESGKNMLFLSSHAKKNELVGLAGLTEW